MEKNDGIKIICGDDEKWKLYDDTYDITIHCESEEEMNECIKKLRSISWIPADKPPEDDRYVLLSFKNFSLPMGGRYERDEDGGGAYYLGDCD